jgi:hypothetical protein
MYTSSDKPIYSKILGSIISIRNSPSKRHKVLTLLGAKIKFKRKQICKIQEGRCRNASLCQLLNNSYEEKSKIEEEARRKIQDISRQLQQEKEERKKDREKITRQLQWLDINIKEIFYSNVLRDCTSNSSWLEDKSLTLTGGGS